MASLPLSDSPAEEEFDLYRDLEKKGVECGLFDPDFDEPHETTLHIESHHFSDNMLRLECEDCSLDLVKPTSKLRTEMRDGVGGGYGLVLLEIGSDTELRVLVLQSDAERQWLACVFNRLAEDPRAYRSGRPLLGCFPAGCLSAPRRRKKEAPEAGAAAQDGSPADAEDKDTGSLQVGSKSNLPWRHPSSPSKPGLPWRRGHHEAPHIELSEVKEHAQKMWQEIPRPNMGRRPSFGLKRASFMTSRLQGRRLSGTEDEGQATRSRTADSQAGAANTPSGNFADRGQHEGGSSSTLGGKGEPPRLDGTCCTNLLLRMLCTQANPRVGGNEADEAHGGPRLFRDVAADPNKDSGPNVRVDFEEFWAVCEWMMLAEQLLKDPELEKRIQQDPATKCHYMDHEKFEWFLVQVQLEKPEKQLAALRRPELNAEGYITIYGLSRLLCSDENSILNPNHAKVYQDMTQPLTSYWIACSHHVYADSTTPPAGASGNTVAGSLSPRDDPPRHLGKDGSNPLDSIVRILRCGCRCINLALVAGAGANGTTRPSTASDGGSTAGTNEVHVLFQQQRVPLTDVLAVIEEHGFDRDPVFPLLLVLSMEMLPSPASGAVPQLLHDGLGSRLWRNTGPELPSPQDASGHAIVILSPAAAIGATGADPSLKAIPPPALSRGTTRSLHRSGAGLPEFKEDADPLDEWQQAAGRFAVWPGLLLDASLPHRSELELSVSFLPGDELQVLEEAKPQPLIEYHRRYLTMAFNVVPRCAQVPFNPASAWSAGIQMAAVAAGLPGDAAALVHAGRFVMDNGNCGYVLKPQHLQRQPREDDVDRLSSSVSNFQDPAAQKCQQIQIRIIAARAVPTLGSQTGPHGQITVSVAVWGAREDCDRQMYQHVKPVSGHVVDWLEVRTKRLQAEAEAAKLNGQGKELGQALKKTLDGPSDLVSFTVATPSTAVMTFELMELNGPTIGKSQCLATFAAPVSGLRSGIRWVPLWSPGSLEECPTEFGALSGLLVECRLEDRKKGSPAKRKGTSGARGRPSAG